MRRLMRSGLQGPRAHAVLPWLAGISSCKDTPEPGSAPATITPQATQAVAFLFPASQQASAEVERKAMKVEFRVRVIPRYIVTRYFEDGKACGSEFKGQYDSAQTAYEVGYALAREEHHRLGYPPGDMRIKYPESPLCEPKIEGLMPEPASQ